MADSKFFGIPFATTGDKAAIPEDVQPSGAISYTQGFGPDYERDPATDPLAKRVPRDETNEIYFQITNAIKFLQLYGTPEWFPLDDAGNPVSYPQFAQVRHDAGSGTKVWVSSVANNTAEPGGDASWVEVSPAIIQSGSWNFGLAGGTGNAVTLALAPAPSLTVGLVARFKALATNSAGVTLNLNSTGAKTILGVDGLPLKAGDIRSGMIVEVVYDGTQWVMTTPRAGLPPTVSNRLVFSTPGVTNWVCPEGVTKVSVRLWAGGGGGGGTRTTANSASASGGGGGYSEKIVSVTPGVTYPVTVGAGGAAGVPGTSPGSGGTGGTSSFGTELSATGGGGGLPADGGIQSGIGAGGVGSGGDLNVPGGSGGVAYFVDNAILLSSGGYSFQTSLAQPIKSTVLVAGRQGVFPGGGGGCAYIGGAGGQGGGGLVILEY